MICPECKNEGVWVDMTFSPGYYYCRTCKDEIKLKVEDYGGGKPKPTQAGMDLLEEFERLLAEGENKIDIEIAPSQGIDFILTKITIDQLKDGKDKTSKLSVVPPNKFVDRYISIGYGLKLVKSEPPHYIITDITIGKDEEE